MVEKKDSGWADLVVIMGAGAEILSISRDIERHTGFKASEVIGKNWFEVFIPEGDHEEIMEVFDEVWTGVDLYVGNENPVRTKDGRDLLFRWDNYVLKDPGGRTAEIISIGTDVT